MAARCHGICSRLPHEKVVIWLSTQLKKLFRFCRRCHLYIKHPVDELYCKCCGCKLRVSTHSGRSKKQVKEPFMNRTKVWRMKHPEEYKRRNKLACHSYYHKSLYYQKNREKLIEKARLYKLKTKLIKIFFITLYPNLLLERNVGYSVRPPQISL